MPDDACWQSLLNVYYILFRIHLVLNYTQHTAVVSWYPDHSTDQPSISKFGCDPPQLRSVWVYPWLSADSTPHQGPIITIWSSFKPKPPSWTSCLGAKMSVVCQQCLNFGSRGNVWRSRKGKSCHRCRCAAARVAHVHPPRASRPKRRAATDTPGDAARVQLTELGWEWLAEESYRTNG